jgi:hypothetical protein
MDGEAIWPILRLKINEELRDKDGVTSRTFKLSISKVLKLLGTFFFGVKEILLMGNYDYWVFSSSDRRKKIGRHYVDRVACSLVLEFPKTLMIENPYPKGRHFRKEEIVDTHIISRTIFFLGVRILEFFVNKNVKLENESLLIELLNQNDIKLDYHSILRNHIAQYRFMKFILRKASPKAAFFVYAASSMGFVKAFKEKRIPVIELQHGVINKEHNAYVISKDYGSLFFPDYLLTYGENELTFFDENNYFIHPNKVFPIGYSFFEEFSKEASDLSYEKNIRNQYEKIIVFSLQEPFEEFVFPFLTKVAELNISVYYILIPRNVLRDYGHLELPKNMIIEKNLNIYECLRIADVHLTVNSTCAIESLYFGVPNILFDYDNWATNYYANILKDPMHTKYVKTAEEFIFALNSGEFHSKKAIIEKSMRFFTRNFTENLRNLLKKEIVTSANE